MAKLPCVLKIWSSPANRAKHSFASQEYQLRCDLEAQSCANRVQTTLLHLAYSGEECETAIKPLDFTMDSIHSRWATGKADMIATLEQLADLLSASPGSLSIFRLEDKILKQAD